MDEEEIWRPFAGFPLYEVSSLGRVRNVKTGRIRKLHVNESGYLAVQVRREDCGRKNKKVYIARAVYASFVGPIPDHYEINHVNFVRTDNRPSNLTATTRAENIEHSRAAGRFSRKLITAQHAEIRHRYSCGAPADELAAEFRVCRQRINTIVQGVKSNRVPWKKLSDAAALDIIQHMRTPRRGLMSALARKYGVSQVAVRKMLQRLGCY